MEKKKFEINFKTQLALAAIMFFAPFVKNMLKTGHFDISQEEEKYVQGYIRLGFLSIGTLLFTITSGLLSYFSESKIYWWIYIISIVLLVLILIIGTIGVILDLKVFQEDNKILFKYKTNKNNKLDILFSYIPIYNIYQWYKINDFEHVYWRAKESIIVWSFVGFFGILFNNEFLISFFLVIVLIRLISLLFQIDFLDEHIKKKINRLFEINPEEIRAYVIGVMIYTYKKMFQPTNIDLFENYIQNKKNEYKKTYKISNNYILSQYIILLIILIWIILKNPEFIGNYRFYIPWGFVVGRYIIAISFQKKLIPIPIINDLFGIIKSLSKKKE